MKKLFATMLTVLACGSAYALPVGNPADASLLCDGVFWEGHCGDLCDPCLTWCDAFSIRVGFWGDYISNRHMQVNTLDVEPEIDVTGLYTNAAFIAGNFWDRFDVFATFGATNIFELGNSSAFGRSSATAGTTPGQTVFVQTETDFSWMIGGRGTVWECGCTTVGLSAQYFSTRPKITKIVANGNILNPNGQLFGTRWYDWQVALGVSHRINMFVPYLAIKWSGAKWNLDDANVVVNDNNLTLHNTESTHTWGYAVGVTLVDCEKASLTFEVRLADELGYHVNGQIRF